MAKQDDYVRVTVRVPADIYASVKEAAGEKSVNAEIIARLSGQQRTLRDEFAGQALGGLISALEPDYYQNVDDAATATAKASYQFADAMLAAREAQP